MGLGLGEECVWCTILNDLTRIQNNDAIKIEDCIKLVSDSDNSVITEFLPNDALHDFICFGVDAVFERWLDLFHCKEVGIEWGLGESEML